MVNQPKRINLAVDSLAQGAQSDARFGPGTGTIIRRLTNYHNIWGSIAVEPANADANQQGIWVLWLKANTNSADTTWSQATIDADDNTMEVIACGVFSCSNQTPFNKEIHLNSSRNLVANQELVLSVNLHASTAGNATVRVLLCASLSVK